MAYDLSNLCSMFQVDCEAVLLALQNGETEKAVHRIKQILISIDKVKKHADSVAGLKPQETILTKEDL